VRGLLKRANIDEKSVTMINMSSAPGRLAALKAKKVDALVGYPPEPEAAIVGGYGEILVDPARDMPDVKSIEYILYFSSGAYITEKPDVVKAFARAVAEASKLINENPDRAREAYFAQMSAKAAGGKIDPKLAKLQWEHMLPYYTADVAIGTDSLAGARQFFHVPATVSDKALVDSTVVPKD
jgi:ABC-type nitrate/sulfonate/bicarbonate transport system substrate-binding protein